MMFINNCALKFGICYKWLHLTPVQDDSYLESYISTIGVDFVSEITLTESLLLFERDYTSA